MSKCNIQRDVLNGCPSPLSFFTKSKSMNYLLLMVEQVQGEPLLFCTVLPTSLWTGTVTRVIFHKTDLAANVKPVFERHAVKTPTSTCFLTSVLDGRTWSASSFCRFNPGECRVLWQNRYVTDMFLLILQLSIGRAAENITCVVQQDTQLLL